MKTKDFQVKSFTEYVVRKTLIFTPDLLQHYEEVGGLNNVFAGIAGKHISTTLQTDGNYKIVFEEIISTESIADFIKENK